MPRGAALWTGEQPRAACLLLGPAQAGLHPIVFTGIDCRFPTTVLWCSLSYCAPLISSRGPRRPASSSVLLLFPWRPSSLNSLRCSERCVCPLCDCRSAFHPHTCACEIAHTEWISCAEGSRAVVSASAEISYILIPLCTDQNALLKSCLSVSPPSNWNCIKLQIL